jgi:hypothetical protein
LSFTRFSDGWLLRAMPLDFPASPGIPNADSGTFTGDFLVKSVARRARPAIAIFCDAGEGSRVTAAMAARSAAKRQMEQTRHRA